MKAGDPNSGGLGESGGMPTTPMPRGGLPSLTPGPLPTAPKKGFDPMSLLSPGLGALGAIPGVGPIASMVSPLAGLIRLFK